ncbi:hypothetical protein ACFPOE_11435 [Caenimonas terrae]|uniref:Uncharacterized protein n=1 Tax=Caenimonas terrae TaxID=696074 RepID=A0ABW0NC41_9BURK
MSSEQQIPLPMLTYYTGPCLVSSEIVAAAKSYRDAVRACWHLRTRRSLTKRALAEEAVLYASHVSDYVSDNNNKRELPARYINAFEIACGNRFISQWLARQARLTIFEELLEQRRAA